METRGISRRALLRRSLLAAGSLAFADRLALFDAATAASSVVELPSAAQVRRDFQRMVDFGPRLTGSDSHHAFVAWLEAEFEQAGCVLLPRDDHSHVLWEAKRVALELLDGPGAGAVPVAAYMPRSQETTAEGVRGPLVYAGVAPVPSVSGQIDDVAALAAALEQYPAQLASWATGLAGSVAGLAGPGKLLLVDLPLPVPLVEGAFAALMTHFHWSGHSLGDVLTRDFKRLALLPAVSPIPTAPFKALGAAGVVFVLDASAQALAGQYVPFLAGFQDLPALWVDRDTGRRLREAAGATPAARLTLEATRRKVKTPSTVAVLPGESDEALILNTHTDGQNFVEENGGVAMVQLARHFASLPADRRLRRTLIFSAVTGHMGYDLPQTEGFIEDHRDLIGCAAAAITVEHLGCSEWIDSADRGYRATGDPDGFFVWTSAGRIFEATRDAVIANDLPHTMLLRGPVQFGIGGSFQGAGVPQVGFLSGPEYLVSIADNGHMDKLDEALAARQIRWIADLLRRLDRVPAAELRAGDPSLGSKAETSCPAFPPRSAPVDPVSMRLTLDRGSAGRLRRRGTLLGRLRLNRAGRVRLRAVVQRGRGRQRKLVELLLRARRPGSTRLRLRLTRRGRAALRSRGRLRVTLTARYREAGRAYVRRAVRALRR